MGLEHIRGGNNAECFDHFHKRFSGKDFLEELCPSEEPEANVRKGEAVMTKTCKFTYVDLGEGSNTWECSECGETLYFDEGMPSGNGYKYCPFCGAYIVEERRFHA